MASSGRRKIETEMQSFDRTAEPDGVRVPA